MQDNKIDLNKASPEELQRIEGIDSERANHLVRTREELGGFKSWEDVDKTPGIGGTLMSKLRQEAELGAQRAEGQKGGAKSEAGTRGGDGGGRSGDGGGRAGRQGEIDLNKASEEELMQIEQMDGTRARKIIENRPFKSWEDVEKIEGIGERMAERLRERATLGGERGSK